MTSAGNCANPQLEIHTVSNERVTAEERAAIAGEFGSKVGPISIQIRAQAPSPDFLDDLQEALAESPDPGRAKSILNNLFGVSGGVGDLICIEQDATFTEGVLLTFRKTQRYHDLLLAIRTGQMDGLVEDVLLN